MEKQKSTETEPICVKRYLDCILGFSGLSRTLNPILLEFLKRSTDVEGGSQVIFVNKAMRKLIAKNCGISESRVLQAITEFIRCGIFSRIDTATYQVSENLSGLGECSDIVSIRARFDFDTEEVKTEIIRKSRKKSSA